MRRQLKRWPKFNNALTNYFSKPVLGEGAEKRGSFWAGSELKVIFLTIRQLCVIEIKKMWMHLQHMKKEEVTL